MMNRITWLGRTRRAALGLLRTLAIAWVGVVVLVAVFQRSITYFPVRAAEAALIAEANRHRLEPWRVDGKIVGWRAPHRSATPANRLVVFHGNAGYALNRWYYAEGFGGLDGGATWDVHLFEYPGYGARPGKVGEEHFVQAGRRALTALAAEDQRPIFLLGESIGSGPACALADGAETRVAGVCLVTPFARFAEVAAHHYPFIPVRLLLQDRWDNVVGLANYGGRLAMWVAGRDEIIPTEQAQRLYGSFGGPKRQWVNPGATHNTIDYSPTNPWWRETSDFLLERP